MEQELASIKKPGEKLNMSRDQYEWSLKEIAKCKRDIVYFAEHYFRIVNLDKGLHVIKLFDIQKDFLQHLVSNNKVICLSGRQQGKCIQARSEIRVRKTGTNDVKNIPVSKLFDTLTSYQDKVEIRCSGDESEIEANDNPDVRKFIQTCFTAEYEIMTDSGWKQIRSVAKTIPYRVFKLETEHHYLECADDHTVFKTGMKPVFVKDLTPGDKIMTDMGEDRVYAVTKTDRIENMYDIMLEDESEHRFYSNGILSHNSTIYCIYALWRATFYPQQKIMILANKLSTALELLGRIQTAYEYLPLWIKSAALTLNKGEISFANMSTIRAFASSSDAARGFSANCLILDEFAFLQKNLADKLFTSMYPVISSSKNGKVIIVSTPNGTDNLYYEIWQQAHSKDPTKNLDGWAPFEMYWWQVPGHDEKWKQQQIAAIGEQRFAQEFNNEFITSSQSRKLIPDDIIEKHRIAINEEKLRNRDFMLGCTQKIMSEAKDRVYEFKMWHGFDEKRTYLASADISEGIGGDSSILYIWDVTDLSKITMCAMFDSNSVSLVEFAYIAKKILALYNNPWLISERNGVSAGMLDSLRVTYQYQNIVPFGKNGEPGIYSHVTLKGKACLWTRDMMTTQGFGFKIYDKCLLDEFSSFVKKDTKGVHTIYQALPPTHDDHVLAFVWACWALHPENIERLFVVCSTFTDSLGNIYPKDIQPMEEYTSADIKNVTQDPMYREYLEFIDDMKHKYSQVQTLENNAQTHRSRYDVFDPYFGDHDICPSWNAPYFQAPTQQQINPNNVMPAFFV